MIKNNPEDRGQHIEDYREMHSSTEQHGCI